MTKLLAGILFILAFNAYAQDPLVPRPSPLEMITMRFEDVYVKVTYCRPSKKDREIFGGLVPYGEVWRTGANEATEITFTQPISIGEELVEAGSYSIFTIPEKESWTIIFSKDLGLWGNYDYNAEHDIARFIVPVQEIDEVFEPFTIEFEQAKLPQTNLVFTWDKTRVVLPLKLK